MNRDLIDNHEDRASDGADIEPCDALSPRFLEIMHDELKDRVGKKRLAHIEGVADTAAELAEIYGLDVRKAKLAGMLHDWDKGYDDEGINARVNELGIQDEVGSWVLQNMPEVVHGISASFALKRDHPHIPDDVIHAIKVHTTACADMSDLDKVLYIADAIEPNREFDEIEDLRGLVGQVELDELYFEVYKFWTEALIERGRVLHPATIDIWNDQCLRRRATKKGSAKKRRHHS